MLTAHSLLRDQDQAQISYNATQAYGFDSLETRFALFEFIILRVRNRADGCLGDIRDAIVWLRQIQQDRSPALDPKAFVEAGFLHVRCELAMASLPRHNIEAIQEFGDERINRRAAAETLAFLVATFTREKAPLVWAEARSMEAVLDPSSFDEDAVLALSDALTVYTRESDPYRWAIAKWNLGEEVLKAEPPQTAVGFQAYNDAMSVLDLEHWPRPYIAMCDELSKAHHKLSLNTAEPVAKKEARLQALRYAVTASVSLGA